MRVGVCGSVCAWECLAGTVVCPLFHHLAFISHENETTAVILFVEKLNVTFSPFPFLFF